jgi:hypothetical protein
VTVTAGILLSGLVGFSDCQGGEDFGLVPVLWRDMGNGNCGTTGFPSGEILRGIREYETRVKYAGQGHFTNRGTASN